MTDIEGVLQWVEDNPKDSGMSMEYEPQTNTWILVVGGFVVQARSVKAAFQNMWVSLCSE